MTDLRVAGNTPAHEARRGVLLQLVRPVARTVPWWALAAGAGLGLLAAALPRLSGGEVTSWAGVNALRAAALCFALGAAFLLDDPARQTTAAVPVRRVLRHALRCAFVLPPAAAWWTAAVLLVPEEARPPAGDITLEAATALALALAGAAFAVRRRGTGRPGQAVAAALLVAAVLAPLLTPSEWSLFTAPGDPRWADGHGHWTLLLCAALLAVAVCCVEPVRRLQPVRRLRTRPARADKGGLGA
ncbi:ABC transporter [Streptomyces althioticus]|uniref:ABC transporter n=1 Tax=Streptomyces althioticus TaxID=83380 RepID=UPI0038734133|nr:ABC transporter [Streptomyces althioticus]